MSEDKKNKIAILLAAYNGKQYIQEQIDSILNQENVNVTIFVSIDPSSDGTRDFLEVTYCNNPHIIILSDVGIFGGAGRNFFRLIRDVDFAPYDYISFADQDDIWYPNKLSRAINKLYETEADGYSSNVLAFWENGIEKLISKAQPQCHYDYLFEAAGPGCTYVMSNALATQIQECICKEWDLVNTVWLHDWFCYAYARAHSFRWVIDEKPTMKYRQHISNQVGVNQGFNAFLYRLKKVLFSGAMTQAKTIAMLIGMAEDPFVKRWITLDRISFLRLALHAKECRRRFKDKYFFFFACIFMSIFSSQK